MLTALASLLANPSLHPCSNQGNNNRACTPCWGGLTTQATGTNDSAGCLAPAGFYYSVGKAIACSRGTYKVSLASGAQRACASRASPPKRACALAHMRTCLPAR